MGRFDDIVIISDGDGTLLGTDHEIPERNLEALREFIGQGGIFILATGRPMNGARHIVSRLPGNALSVYFNGALIYDHEKDAEIYSDPLPAGMGRVAAFAAERFPELGFEYFTMDDARIIRDGQYSRGHFELLREEIRYAVPEEVPEKGVLKMFATGEREELDVLREALLKEFPGMFNAVPSGTNYLEIFSITSSKGNAVSAIRDWFGGTKKIYAVGDSENDISMFRNADGSYVAGNARPEIREYGRVVCGCDDGVIADVIGLLE